MKRIIIGLAGVVLAVGLTACGGNESESYDDAQAVADAIGNCEGFTESEPDVFAESTGECQVDGKPFEISVFGSEQERDQYVGAGESIDEDFELLVGSNWVVTGWEGGYSVVQDAIGGDFK